jgi:hypothetical protein
MAGFLRLMYKTIDMKKKLFVAFLAFSFFLSVSGMSDPLKDGEQLSMYPNPASTELTINIDLEYSSTTNLKIIDLTGKTVKDFTRDLSHENGMYKAQLDISDLKAGIYFVRVKQQNEVLSKKLQVQGLRSLENQGAYFCR